MLYVHMVSKGLTIQGHTVTYVDSQMQEFLKNFLEQLYPFFVKTVMIQEDKMDTEPVHSSRPLDKASSVPIYQLMFQQGVATLCGTTRSNT